MRRYFKGLFPIIAAVLLAVLNSAPANAVDAPDGEGGYHHIVNRRSGLCLAVPGGSQAPAEQLNQFTCGAWADHFWNVEYKFKDSNLDRWYYIKNKNSDMCLSVDAARTESNAPVTQYPCGGHPDQYWKISGWEFRENGQLISGEALINWNSGLCMAPLGGSSANTAPIIQTSCASASDRIWL
ncbi:RICIN domain-containing protein [Streptomyces sp. NPDC092952]|uniref:RICIN domain-containing protein n=1 Tax=Streptomyces sp. NPDC092952 TaxID=3366018 RepID=UPI0037FF8B1F